MLAARKVVAGPFLVVNADDFYGSTAYAMAASFIGSTGANQGPGHLGLVAFPLRLTLGKEPVNRGICRSHNLMLSGVDEHKNISRDADGVIRGDWKGERVELDEESLASMNFWILQHETLSNAALSEELI